MRVFVDANVLFSASLSGQGNAAQLLAIGHSGGCILLTSAHAMREAERNLTRKRPEALGVLRAHISQVSVLAEEPSMDLVHWAESLGLPAKDSPILAAAILARASLLVTGDRRHFGPHYGRTLKGVRVVSLAEGLLTALTAAEGKERL